MPPRAAKRALHHALLLLVLLTACSPAATPAPTPRVASAPSLGTANAPSANIRPAAFAGQFYPADPGELQAVVDAYLNQAHQAPQEPMALIAPHAGYVYSGGVAASAFKQVQGRHYDAVVVIGARHNSDDSRISIWAEGAYATPLGLMPIDSELAQAILAVDPRRFTAEAGAHLVEHVIEVEVPFLQRAIGPQPFVPILMGSPSLDDAEALATALVTVLRGKRALIIASTDLSHYPGYDRAVQSDRSTLLALSSLDPRAVHQDSQVWLGLGIANLVCTVCSEGAVAAAMLAARELGANRVSVIDYANSGDSPYGDRNQVVGYGALSLWKQESSTLSEEEQVALLRLARQTVQEYLSTGNFTPYETAKPALTAPSGAFVTLKQNGALRGCIGHMWSDEPLYHTVQQMAIAAATEDPRFPAVTVNELSGLTLEVSVLTPLQYVGDVEEIEVGRDGLYIVYGPWSGVLLPQVASEQGWDRMEFLRQVCLKAGLPSDVWQKGATLYRFSAQVFAENE